MHNKLSPENLLQYSDGELPPELLAKYPIAQTSVFEKSNYDNNVTQRTPAQNEISRDAYDTMFTGQLSSNIVSSQYIILGILILGSIAGFLVCNLVMGFSSPVGDLIGVYTIKADCSITNNYSYPLEVGTQQGKVIATLNPGESINTANLKSNQFPILFVGERFNYQLTYDKFKRFTESRIDTSYLQMSCSN